MKLIAFLLLCFFQIGYARGNDSLADETVNHRLSNISILTMAKGGTHLLKKAIYLITGTELNLDKTNLINDKTVYFNHLWPTTPLSIKNNQHILKILLIRDPRDMLISQLYWICYAKNWGGNQLTIDELNEFYSLSINDKISYLINFPQHAFGMTALAHVFSSWIDGPAVIMIRFEDLVGPNGGGTLEKQHDSIRMLAEYLGYDLSQEEISTVCEHMYGDSITFREGKIGAWKEHFTEEHKEAFKEVAGMDLIKLGYECDYAW